MNLSPHQSEVWQHHFAPSLGKSQPWEHSVGGKVTNLNESTSSHAASAINVLCDLRQVSSHLVISATVVDWKIFKEPFNFQNFITSN